MPKAWRKKDERQYDKVKASQKERGASEDRAKEAAARVVNKTRRKEGQTENKRAQGTGNPKTSLEDRKLIELQNQARQLSIPRYSTMRKKDLVQAIRNRH